ncbi:hypothetical protein EW146_g4689 [Bondarzewia mesenterica]|uniref:Actinin-like protein n=1 Tax=Bondarzewia mesenterica TaxID=1095465 RepID=A0A4S4LTR6_9AGAM|nr:hypothetical protein EW146_g4689 [Bondarzewia mesenterica]
MNSLNAHASDTQERTFCKWLNTKLESNGYPLMTSLVKDLSDGVRLIQLMEIMGELDALLDIRSAIHQLILTVGDVSLGRYNRNPRMRIQKAENVNKALEFITSRGVKLTNIGPEDIIDGNLKLILGMIWTLILRFTIADISEEGLSAKEGLLLWCQRKTEPYKEVNVQDFSLSWSDGLALCALIHCHRPDLIDYDKLDKSDRHGNTQLAFDVAAEHLGIPQLLEVADLCDSGRPDERSVMTYIASFFHAFSSMDQAETVSRRIEKFAELMQSIWVSRNDYERRVRALLSALEEIQDHWAAVKFTGTYADAKEHSASFAAYKQTKKRTWVTEKQDVATLFGNVQTKLKTYGLREYVPPPGVALSDVDNGWNALLASEAKRSRAINAQIREIKESLRKKFADLANDFQTRLHTVSTELSAIEGPLEEQQEKIDRVQTRIPALSEALATVESVESEIWNSSSSWSCKASRRKLHSLINQIVSRNMTNLTPAQLEQFESTFRYFDRDESNTLNQSEMTAALASLGIVYTDEDMDIIYDQLVQDYGAVTFEAFINLLVDITEDQTSPDQLREAFQGAAANKPYVTELDLRLAHIPASAVDYLREVMPAARNGAGEPEYDYEAWLDRVFDNGKLFCPAILPLRSLKLIDTAQASGITVNPSCLEAFQELKLGKKTKYIIFDVNDDRTEIVVAKTSTSSSYDDFIGDLPEGECRWAVYDLSTQRVRAG